VIQWQRRSITDLNPEILKENPNGEFDCVAVVSVKLYSNSFSDWT
jgi:hypothetical protein